MTSPICIVGTGYVGMACMIGLAELGWSVNGYDIAPERIERLRAGVPPYREPGIEEALRKHIDAGKLQFFDSVDAAARNAEIIIVAVGTPSREDGSADVSALFTAVEAFSKIRFARWPTIVIRSTVPPGTTDALADLIEHAADVIYAPEFLREGSAVRDFLNPDRIVVGAPNAAAAVPYAKLLEKLQRPVVFTSRSNAEMIKCCSNAFLALKISFANEVANLCDAIGSTSDDVLRGIGYDRRIGSDFLQPGIGFGGPCLEKDTKSMQYVATQAGAGHELFSATLRVNVEQPRRIVEALEDELGTLHGTTIGIWGLTFKAHTDDMRDSLALRIVNEIARRGATTIAYDPAIHMAPLPLGTRFATSALEAANADALVVLTDWPQFAKIDPVLYADTLRRRFVLDGRNALDAQRVISAGLRYRGIGRSYPANAASASIAALGLSS
jgi:UDPglucose 6-dehydrogenase